MRAASVSMEKLMAVLSILTQMCPDGQGGREGFVEVDHASAVADKSS